MSPPSSPTTRPAASLERARRILLVEDCDDDAALVLLALKRADLTLEPLQVQSETAFRAALDQPQGWDVILCDYDVPGFGAPHALDVVQELQLDIPFIVMSGHVDEEQAVTVLRRGAHDFVSKNRLTRLAPAINREVKEAQLRVTARQELEAAQAALLRGERLRTLGELAAGIAHDLRNILNPLSLQVQVLQRGKTSAEQLVPIAEGMARTLKRGAELFHRLQQFSKQGPQGLVDCDVRAEVEQALNLLREKTRRVHGLQVERFLEDVGMVRAPPSELVSATVNLVTNAIEALDSTANARILVRVRPDGQGVLLEVEDNGPGMPPELQERVFEPFFTTKNQGTGLGLAGIASLMRRCDGTVDLNSALGRGTTIRLWFPRSPER